MRCASCHKLSTRIVCYDCQQTLLVPTISKRKIGTLEVVSLFKYRNIEPFLLTKHTPIGYRIYKYFSKLFVGPFLEEFAQNIDEPVTLVAIDEQVKGGYSHTSLLAHYAQNPKIITTPASLLARNSVSYAGKPLSYRLEHPRDFNYTGKSGLEVILLDDIITTGITLQEAQQELHRHDIEVLFSLTIADAED